MRKALQKMDEKVGPTSPMPYILQLRNWIFGKEKPEVWTRIAFFICLPIVLINLLWHAISYFAFSAREVIYQNKKVDIAALAQKRAGELQMNEGDAIELLSTFHAISMILWLLAFVGLVCLYRRKKIFVVITVGSFFLYLAMMGFYLGGAYVWKETTNADKLLLTIYAAVLLGIYRLRYFSESTNEEEDPLDNVDPDDDPEREEGEVKINS